MKVGSLEGRLEEPLFCKKIFVSKFIRERWRERALRCRESSREERRRRDEILLQSSPTHIVINIQSINTKSIFHYL
jgi:hypothetical protein